MKKTIQAILLVCYITSFGQKKHADNNWHDFEKAYYKTLKEFSEYTYLNKKSEISNDTIFKKFVHFDYVINDTVQKRKQERLQKFDILYSRYKTYIDSIGIENLDAKPLRFYNKNKDLEYFNNKQLQEIKKDVFIYYKKDKPDLPLGTLWFDPKTHKLISWILINQGGYYYFLTFNLLGNEF